MEESQKQEYVFTCRDEEELNKYKTRAMKLKIILLDSWDKHPLENPACFNKRQKERFTKELENLWNKMNDEEIDKEFNDICCSRLFNSGSDISSYPVYEPIGTPNHSVLYENTSEVDNTN